MKLILILRNQVSIEQQSIPLDTTRFPYTKIKITYKNQFQINTMLEDQMRRKQIEGSKWKKNPAFIVWIHNKNSHMLQ